MIHGYYATLVVDSFAELPANCVPGQLAFVLDTGIGYRWTSMVWVAVTVPQLLVRGLADLPAPVAGVITLLDNTTYKIVGTVDIGTNRIVAGIRNTIIADSRVNDKLVSQTTGIMFTAGAGKISLIFNEVGLQCPNGTLLSVVGTSIAFLNVTFMNVLNMGNVDACPAFTIRNSGLSNSVTGGGFTFTGASTGHFQVRDNIISNNAGVLFALGTAVYRTISVGRNNVTENAGQTFLSGIPGNASLSGKLADNIFDGAGTYVTGITGNDAPWQWTDNHGPLDSGKVKRTADQTFNSATLANVTGLSFPVVAGRYYQFKFVVPFRSNTAAIGIKLGLTCPAFTQFAALVQIPVAGDGVSMAWQGQIRTSGGFVTGNAVFAINQDFTATIEGTILPTANGVLQVQAANETGVTPVIVRQGSCGVLTDLGT